MAAKNGYRVGVLGATGAVGSTILRVLEERDFPAGEVVPLASARSAGNKLEFRGGKIEVREISEEAVEGLDLVLSSAGGKVSAEWAPTIVDAGAVVVDNTSYWRMYEKVPLVVAEVNPDALSGHQGIIANPNCTTMQMVVALAPIHREAGIKRLILSSYQSVSGTGHRAIEELNAQTEDALAGRETTAKIYPHPIAFNVLPQVETFKDGDDYTTEERKVMAETRKILGVGDEIGISATCARVPVIAGHSESINIETRDDLSPEDCRELLASAPGRRGHRQPVGRPLPDTAHRRRPRRGPGRAHPPRPQPPELPQPLGRRRQPPQGSGDERGPGGGAADRAGSVEERR